MRRNFRRRLQLGAYYNEIDPKKAAWLRELISRGIIAPGDVDERSIADVRPADLAGYSQCHFFAGVGIWSYALRLAGWPDEREAWTGSCPCQPLSAAGKGEAFDDERHLWPVWFPLIEARRPVVCFGEQVASIDGLAWLDLVQSDLDDAGYTCGAVDLCAAGFGAPHRRQRLYWVADSNHRRSQERRAEIGGENEYGATVVERFTTTEYRELGGLADGHRNGRGAVGAAHGVDERDFVDPSGADGGLANDSRRGCGVERDASHPGNSGHNDRSSSAIELGIPSGAGLEERGNQPGDLRQEHAVVERASQVERLGHTDRLHSEQPQGTGTGTGDAGSGWPCGQPSGSSEAGGLGDPEGSGWGGSVRECGPFPSQSKSERAGAVNGFWRSADWVLTRPQRVGDRPGLRPVERGAFRLAHGTPQRVGRLRGYGDGIVAQAAQAFIEAYMAERGPFL